MSSATKIIFKGVSLEYRKTESYYPPLIIDEFVQILQQETHERTCEKFETPKDLKIYNIMSLFDVPANLLFLPYLLIYYICNLQIILIHFIKCMTDLYFELLSLINSIPYSSLPVITFHSHLMKFHSSSIFPERRLGVLRTKWLIKI